MNANLCALPVELKELILSKIERIEAHHILALSSTFQEAFSLFRALPRPLYFEGVEGDIVRLLVVRLLDNDRVRSLGKERALELIGVHKDRLCEYACVQGNFEVLKWAHNKLELPWATRSCTSYPGLYPAEPVSDDVLVLRMLRDTWPMSDEPGISDLWPEGARPEDWRGVTMENGRVVKLVLEDFALTGPVPAAIGRLSALRHLNLYCNELMSLPAEIGQLTSLKRLYLYANHLTSLPAEIRQLTALETLKLGGNQLTRLPAEFGQLSSLKVLFFSYSQLSSLPAEIGQLTSLRELSLLGNELTSLPAEIWQLTSLRELHLRENQLTSVPAAIRKLRAAGCRVHLDEDVTVDE